MERLEKYLKQNLPENWRGKPIADGAITALRDYLDLNKDRAEEISSSQSKYQQIQKLAGIAAKNPSINRELQELLASKIETSDHPSYKMIYMYSAKGTFDKSRDRLARQNRVPKEVIDVAYYDSFMSIFDDEQLSSHFFDDDISTLKQAISSANKDLLSEYTYYRKEDYKHFSASDVEGEYNNSEEAISKGAKSSYGTEEYVEEGEKAENRAIYEDKEEEKDNQINQVEELLVEVGQRMKELMYPKPVQQLFELRYLKKQSVKQISKEMGLSFNVAFARVKKIHNSVEYNALNISIRKNPKYQKIEEVVKTFPKNFQLAFDLYYDKDVTYAEAYHVYKHHDLTNQTEKEFISMYGRHTLALREKLNDINEFVELYGVREKWTNPKGKFHSIYGNSDDTKKRVADIINNLEVSAYPISSESNFSVNSSSKMRAALKFMIKPNQVSVLFSKEVEQGLIDFYNLGDNKEAGSLLIQNKNFIVDEDIWLTQSKTGKLEINYKVLDESGEFDLNSKVAKAFNISHLYNAIPENMSISSQEYIGTTMPSKDREFRRGILSVDELSQYYDTDGNVILDESGNKPKVKFKNIELTIGEHVGVGRKNLKSSDVKVWVDMYKEDRSIDYESHFISAFPHMKDYKRIEFSTNKLIGGNGLSRGETPVLRSLIISKIENFYAKSGDVILNDNGENSTIDINNNKFVIGKEIGIGLHRQIGQNFVEVFVSKEKSTQDKMNEVIRDYKQNKTLTFESNFTPDSRILSEDRRSPLNDNAPSINQK